MILRMGELKIPEEFQFSATSLQDFEDCRFRFWLRYIQQVAWPAVPSEPALEVERRMQLGSRFHQLLQAYFSGVPSDRLSQTVNEPELAGWWANFLNEIPPRLEQSIPERRFVEIQLSAPLKGHRLVAKIDFVCQFEDGSWTIFDWKTNRKRPSRSWLGKSLQTRLYSYLLVRLAPTLNQGQDIPADKVKMAYWFAAIPDQPEEFDYSSARFKLDEEFFSGLLTLITNLDEIGFEKTNRIETCSFCVYRSLCERGVEAGDESGVAEFDIEKPGLNFDFEQVAEVDYQ